MASSPRVRPPLALAVGMLTNSPAPMVPAPTASDVPKNERRLIELFKGLTLSSSFPPESQFYSWPAPSDWDSMSKW